MSPWILFVIATSAMLLTVATGKDDQLSRKFPTNINFYKLFSESAPCNPIYGDYESCENSQRYFNYEYGSEEENVSKQKLDLLAAEEKRGHGHARAGCDCQLSTGYIDLGTASYPRWIKNVTCDENRRCFQSRSKGYHCQPLVYDVSVMTQGNRIPDQCDGKALQPLPSGLKCCWIGSIIKAVVGCICGLRN